MLDTDTYDFVSLRVQADDGTFRLSVDPSFTRVSRSGGLTGRDAILKTDSNDSGTAGDDEPRARVDEPTSAVWELSIFSLWSSSSLSFEGLYPCRRYRRGF